MTTSEKPHNPAMRGRINVEHKLLNAACRLLAKKGPKGVSNRDIAKHAGVNHGQIHHYFGSKRGLLEAAISKLAYDHWEHTQLDGMTPLALGKDQTYILAVIRCAIDGELELATLELRKDISVPRQSLKRLLKNRAVNETEVEVKGRMATAMAIELAWAISESYITAMVDIKPNEVDIVKQKMVDILMSIVEY